MSLEDKLEETFKEEMANVKYNNIMIIGGTGVGKSSLVNKIFNRNVAEVGSAQSTTRGIKKYLLKKEKVCIFDTEGYEIVDGRVNNDNFQKDVLNKIKERQNKELSRQIHIFWYCISVVNHRIQPTDIKNINLLNDLGLKLAIVLTKCDQDELLEGGKGKIATEFKKVLEEEEITNSIFETMINGGAQTLELGGLMKWSVENIPSEDLKIAFVSAQKSSIGLKDDSAKKIIYLAAVSATGIGAANFIPMSDALVLAPIQMGMAVELAKIYSFDELGEMAVNLLETQLISLIGKQTVASLTKLIPVLGQVINASVAGGLTAALGFALQQAYREAYLCYLERGKIPDLIKIFNGLNLKDIFLQYKEQGKK